jgi:hypothetical protein
MPENPTTAVAVIPHETPQTAVLHLGGLEASGPAGVVTLATAVATELAAIVKKQGLSQNIGGKAYVRIEGWTTLAALLGTTVRELEVREDESGDVVAVVELARVVDGVVLGRASALVGADERTWAGRPRFARRSMCVSRASGKVCRLCYSWVMSLSGFEPCPLEELQDAQAEPLPRPAPAAKPAPRPAADAELVAALGHLVNLWKAAHPGEPKDAFAGWAGKAVGAAGPLRDLADWSLERVKLCHEALVAQNTVAESDIPF